jgi:hypothetical protein
VVERSRPSEGAALTSDIIEKLMARSEAQDAILQAVAVLSPSSGYGSRSMVCR